MSLLNEIRKARVKLILPFARSKLFSEKTSKKQSLVMTLLVRNEEDILRANLEHHYAQGVDFIVATDNASDDNTRAILQEYERQGRLHLIDEPDRDYAQALWVNRMANWAYDRFGDCFIFHADADEFWISRSGDLRNELARHSLIDYLDVEIKNILLRFDNFEESFPDSACLYIKNPYATNDVRKDSLYKSFYLFPCMSKVIFRARRGVPLVKMGNHELETKRGYVRSTSRDIYVYHFPVRGYKHFEQKVVVGGAALVSNPNLNEDHGWHWRRWYKSWQEGKLKESYRLLCLDAAQASALSREGVLDIDESIPVLFKSRAPTADKPRHHVIITGTGRAGTTFLVQLLTELGLDTGFKDPFENIKSSCNAGMELELDDSNAPYIVKNPDLCNTLASHMQTGKYVIDHAFIPVRNLEQSAKSRIHVSSKRPQRWWKRMLGHHKFKSVDGGMLGTGDPNKQQDTLANLFFFLIETITRYDIPHTFLEFPRITSDTEYLYKKLAPVMQGISYEKFTAAHSKVANTRLINRF